MQLGGLGIMSLTAALALLLGRGIGVRENRLMREVFQVPMLQQVQPILRFILLWTLATEALGTVALYSSLDGLVADPGDRLFCALFHAVSAFCNAGFSIFPDSLVGWSTRPAGVLTVAGLLILGGLGFVVALDLLRVAHASGRGLPRSTKPRLSLQTRVVLGWTAGLLLAGTAFLLGLEHGGALSEMGWRDGLLHAFFQAATCRTAGFNSLDLTALAPASLFLMILLMFVGAGPGSTAGGVKISTVAVVAAEIRAIAAGRRQARIGRRELDDQDRHRATVVLTTAALLAALGTLLLLITERSSFLTTVFEAVSALGTVGLSLGLTPQLSGAGKIVVMLLMFVGRLGVLTFAYVLVRPARDATVRLPRSGLMIG
jgi:trk system potassium uptake protein TrkH